MTKILVAGASEFQELSFPVPSQENTCIIEKIPYELILHITNFMPLEKACHFLQTCKQLQILQNDVAFWRTRLDESILAKEEETSLTDLKLLNIYQEPLLSLYQHLSVTINLPMRGVMAVHSSLPAADITKLADRIPHSLTALKAECQWLVWCAHVPGIIHARKEIGWVPTEGRLNSWRDHLKLIAPRHPQAGLLFALLNQVIRGQSVFTIKFVDSNQELKLELKPWAGVYDHYALTNASFKLAIKHNIPTAAFEYGASLRYLHVNGFKNDCLAMLRKAQDETDNWSGGKAKLALAEIMPESM